MKQKWINLKGIKLGMSQIFDERGVVTPVTEVGVEAGLQRVQVGDNVIASGLSKGRGFTGVVKRWGFAGGPATHGSGWMRKTGSIGGTTTPGRVYKGKKMPGRFGGSKVLVKGLKIAGVNKEENKLTVTGALPGHRNGKVLLRVAVSEKKEES